MMLFALSLPLLWSIPLAEAATRLTFRWARIESPEDWVLPGLVLAAAIAYVIYVYRKDAAELRRPWPVVLTALRTLVIVGLFLLWLEPGWYAEREVVFPSRVDVVIDGSSSMSVPDAATPGGSTRPRFTVAGDVLLRRGLLEELAQRHDVAVYRFDRAVQQLGRVRRADFADQPAGQPPEPEGATPPADPLGGLREQLNAAAPDGDQTRLGDALAELLRRQRDHPPAAVVVLSDGCNNAGVSPDDVAAVQEPVAPVISLGFGDTESPENVAVDRMEVVRRIYPGDPFQVTGLIRHSGMTGRSVDVELLIREAGGQSTETRGTGAPLASQQVTLGEDAVTPVEFQSTLDELGKYVLCVRVSDVPNDSTPADNFRETTVEVIDRKDRVLLFAGGPTRDYQFARSVLWRDPSITVDLLLQTAQPGISQEGDAILSSFPESPQEMYQYDVLIAFDPNWAELADEQLELLEKWVAEQAGGLIIEAGRVYMGSALEGWTQNPAMRQIRALLPVEVQRNVGVTQVLTYTSEEPWPLDFTREGWNAEFLWLADTAEENMQRWETFPGVYSCHLPQAVKPGATVLAWFGDPSVATGTSKPPYLAEQFYGAGRVVYLGSGELWRLRGLDPAYFERLYVNLVRHAGEGRAARQSSRGLLLVSPASCMIGSSVAIRAQLTDARLEPLEAPAVDLEVISPQGGVRSVTLRQEPNRPGMFVGHLVVLEEGQYRLTLGLPDTPDERLTQEIQVRVPDLEREQAARNVALLERLASMSGGRYYDGESLDRQQVEQLAGAIRDRSRSVLRPIGIDINWEKQWLGWMLGGIVALLALEWLIRRLNRLA